jgi:hypothetical protein
MIAGALTLSLLLPQTALAWNDEGHMAVAAIAYMNLSTAPAHNTRARVDALLRLHPDLRNLTTALAAQGITPADPNFNLFLFMKAATWPDMIRGDSRFFFDADPLPRPPLLAGFPDMNRNRDWHFINMPFSTDGTPTNPPREPNAMTAILALRLAIANPAVQPSFQAYDLAWLLHLVGDIHQPLHSIARFSRLHANGDLGGNSFLLNDATRNLHSFWDDTLGMERNPANIIAVARSIVAEVPLGNQSNPARQTDEIIISNDAAAPNVVHDWVDESAALAKYFVYTFGQETAATPHPAIPVVYRNLATTMARHRVALAGYRLAAILNDKLR